MPLFDSYLVVDWSAAAVPKTGRDSIWSALLTGGQELRLVNHRTRHECEAWLRDVATCSGRLLAGFDFSFGYPSGFAARLTGAEGAEGAETEAPWRVVWSSMTEQIDDRPDNANNRFEVAARLNARCGDGPGPFWGCPPARATPDLSTRKVAGFPHEGIEEFRITERVVRDSGRWVSSSWQLLGAGSVGSQMLVGIPVLERLRRDPPEGVRVDVWPFTTGLSAPRIDERRTQVVLAEVWPSMVRPDPDRHPVKDAQQVIALCEHLAALDDEGSLGTLFEPAVPPEVLAEIVTDEGWILGVTG